MRNRLTLGVTAVLAVLLALAGVLVARDAERSDRESVDDRLKRTAELSRATAVAAVESELPGGDRRLEDVLRATGSSLRLTLGDRVVLEAGNAPPLRPKLGLHTVGDVRTYAERLTAPGLSGLARLELTSSLRPIERRADDRRRRLILFLGGALIASAIGVWFAADIVLRPLRRLREATARIATEEDLETGVPEEGPSELRSLASSFNAMLGRLRRSADDRTRALEATRRFAADAGHELRTPLTSVQATLSALSRHPELDARKRTAMAVDALAEQRRLVDLLDGLQALARGDATQVAQAEVELGDVVDGAVAAARTRWPQTRFASEIPSADVVRRGWEPGLRLIVDNLVENAARHGREGGTVRVVLTPTALVVEDDGPGIPPADRERVLEPFARVTSPPAPDRPGSGLGLALVAQQARLHAATIAIDASPQLGGARVTVRWDSAAR